MRHVTPRQLVWPLANAAASQPPPPLPLPSAPQSFVTRHKLLDTVPALSHLTPHHKALLVDALKQVGARQQAGEGLQGEVEGLSEGGGGGPAGGRAGAPSRNAALSSWQASSSLCACAAGAQVAGCSLLRR